MAQPAPSLFRLTEHQTNDTIFKLEERKYGRRLSSMELAKKAEVALDYVNCIERQRRVTDRHAVERIAHALGISASLLCKISGVEAMSQEEWTTLQRCLESAPAGQPVPPQCAQIGVERIWT